MCKLSSRVQITIEHHRVHKWYLSWINPQCLPKKINNIRSTSPTRSNRSFGDKVLLRWFSSGPPNSPSHNSLLTSHLGRHEVYQVHGTYSSDLSKPRCITPADRPKAPWPSLTPPASPAQPPSFQKTLATFVAVEETQDPLQLQIPDNSIYGPLVSGFERGGGEGRSAWGKMAHGGNPGRLAGHKGIDHLHGVKCHPK